MALKTAVTNGDQVLTRARTETRIFITTQNVGALTTVPIRHVEVTETIEETWYALTKAAAEAERDANAQPEDEDAKYTYSVDLGRREGGIMSYTLTRTFLKVTTTTTPELTPSPDVTFSPATGVKSTATPLDVTLQCSDADAWIFYTIGIGSVPADPTTGSDKVPAGAIISTQLQADVVTTIKAFAYVFGKLVSSVTSITYTGESA